MSARVPTPSDRPASATSRRRHSRSSRSSWSRASGTARSGRSYTRFQPRRSAQTTSPVSSSHSTAILVSDHSNHSPPFLAPPSPVEVSGPSARSRSRTVLVERSLSWRTCQRWPRARRARRRNAKCGHSSIGRMQAACDQYSKACRSDQYAASTAGRPTAPRRAYGISSCERARTEIVSSWTAPRWRRTPRTPPRRSGAPRKPCARSAIRRASSADRDTVGGGTVVIPEP